MSLALAAAMLAEDGPLVGVADERIVVGEAECDAEYVAVAADPHPDTNAISAKAMSFLLTATTPVHD